MSTEEIRSRVTKIVAQALKVAPSELTDESGLGEHPGWDSLGHIDIIVRLEKEFGMRFEMPEFVGITTIRLLVEVLESKRRGNG